jgi:hypothetical protein
MGEKEENVEEEEVEMEDPEEDQVLDDPVQVGLIEVLMEVMDQLPVDLIVLMDVDLEVVRGLLLVIHEQIRYMPVVVEVLEIHKEVQDDEE